MMCLGWKAQRACVDLTEPGGCADVSWFWLALAAIGVGAVMKGSGKKEVGPAA